MKEILMVAGPNGAGKTTMVRELLLQRSTLYDFLNADEIAFGLAPLHPESVSLSASKLMIIRLKELLNTHKSFAFETTAAGTNYVKHLKSAKDSGYIINVVFLWLASPLDAVKRVAQRVKQGGHSIPEQVIVKRYSLGLKNLFNHYLILADTVLVLDNSSEEIEQRLIARKEPDSSLEIINHTIWQKMKAVTLD